MLFLNVILYSRCSLYNFKIVAIYVICCSRIERVKTRQLSQDFGNKIRPDQGNARSLIVRYFNPVINNTVYFAVHGARFGEGTLIEVNTREGRRRTSISSETMNN